MRLLFFAQLREVTGQQEMELRFEAPVTAEQLWERLIERLPKLEQYRHHVRLARNCEYAGPGERFVDSDEVAFIPPVSGG